MDVDTPKMKHERIPHVPRMSRREGLPVLPLAAIVVGVADESESVDTRSPASPRSGR